MYIFPNKFPTVNETKTECNQNPQEKQTVTKSLNSQNLKTKKESFTVPSTCTKM